MLNLSGKWLKDAGERILWTAISAGAATAITYMGDIHTSWAPVLTIALTTLKTFAAHFVGNSDTAAMSGE